MGGGVAAPSSPVLIDLLIFLLRGKTMFLQKFVVGVKIISVVITRKIHKTQEISCFNVKNISSYVSTSHYYSYIMFFLPNFKYNTS